MVRRFRHYETEVYCILIFTDTITLYNHYVDTLTRADKWNRTVLDRCMWRPTTTKSVIDGRIQVDDSISLTILKRDSYIAPKEYAKLPNDQKPNYFTLDSDSNLDVVVLGNVENDITETYTFADLRKDHDVYIISAVADNTLVPHLKHWKVTAK